MDTLPNPFTLTLNNAGPITLPNSTNDDTRIDAFIEPQNPPALFTLNDGVLESNGWILGRDLVEDRSLNPKKVYWFQKDREGFDVERIHKTILEVSGDLHVLKNGNAPIFGNRNALFASLMGDEGDTVLLQL